MGATISELEKMDESNPRWPRVVRWLVRSIFGLAIASGSLSSAQGGGDWQAIFTEATSAMKAGLYKQAAEDFRRVIALRPGLAPAYLNDGLALQQLGDHAAAVEQFRKCLALQPTMRGVHLLLGVSLYKESRLEEARTELKKEVLASPKDPKALMWLGVVDLADGLADEAADVLDRAAILSPDDVDILYHRGRAHLLVSNESYERMYQADPQSWRVHEVLAEAYAEADRHSDAETEYLLAIKASPTSSGLHYELGIEYEATTQLDKAMDSFREEMKIDPENALAVYQLGRLFIDQQNAAQGMELLHKALAMSPNLPGCQYYLGVGDAQQKRFEAAISDFKKEIETGKDEELKIQSYYQLARAYHEMKQPDQAQEALAKFQELKDQRDTRQKNNLLRKMKEQHDVLQTEKAPD